jgi:chromosome segregation ATPase
MRYTEHDDDRMIRVRASVIDGGERRIRELEGELEAANKHVELVDLQHEEAGKRIAELEAELAKWKQTDNVRLEADNARLRECLKRLEWCITEWHEYKDNTHACPVCDSTKEHEDHASDCWLAAALKENQ